MAVYNGITLPDIPESVAVNYPYQTLIFISELGVSGYVLIASQEKFQFLDNGFYCNNDTKVYAYYKYPSLSTNSETWDDESQQTYPAGEVIAEYITTDEVTLNLFWTNIEELENTYYKIKKTLLLDLAVQSRRLGKITNGLTIEDIQETLRNTLDFEGNDVTFHGFGGKIECRRIKDGVPINPPYANAGIEKWADSAGNVLEFPYIPTGDIDIYASPVTYTDLLYQYIGIEKLDYPYIHVCSDSESIRLYFITGLSVSKIEDLASSVPNCNYYQITMETKGYVFCKVMHDGLESNLSMKEIVNYILENPVAHKFEYTTASPILLSYDNEYTLTNFEASELGIDAFYGTVYNLNTKIETA